MSQEFGKGEEESGVVGKENEWEWDGCWANRGSGLEVGRAGLGRRERGLEGDGIGGGQEGRKREKRRRG